MSVFFGKPFTFKAMAIESETLQAIIDAIAEGSTLDAALKGRGISASSFNKALEHDFNSQNDYHRARCIAADRLADQIIPIADDRSIDPNQARNMIEARKWVASKRYPKVYGDRIDLTVTERVDLSQVLERANARVLPLRDLKSFTPNEVIETIQVTRIETSGLEPEAETKPDISELDPDAMLE